MEAKIVGQGHNSRVSGAGLLIALGIIYGDIGTSPLYVMKAVVGTAGQIDENLVLGAVSCVFWTLTILVTLKYMVLTLNADNRGEGGIFALFALVRRYKGWLVVPGIIGGASLLADGMITPPISISSAVEGLEIIYPGLETVPIVLVLLTGLFLLQAFGTTAVGQAFGPVMILWFSMLFVLGLISVVQAPIILKALNPYYAYELLAHYPKGYWMLGGVFLCCTGAESVYSDLGHCGRGNIRVSWGFVKAALLLNYFGQGAYLLRNVGKPIEGIHPFYDLMPDWFLWPGIIIATLATIIASQALISGSFTLVAEALRLNLWPKVKLMYPSRQKGQLFVPSVNKLLWAGCVGVVLYFQKSENMEAAYGLAINITMMATTTLLAFYLYANLWRKYRWAVFTFILVFASLEVAFLVANLLKFMHGGWVSIVMAGLIGSVMVVWFQAFLIKDRLTEFDKIEEYVDQIKDLSKDETIPKYATHLVFLTNAHRDNEIEKKIIYSIFQKRPKRADIYWFVHVETTDDPYQMEYKVDVIVPDDLYKITFFLGFKVEQRINLFFRKVIEDMVRRKEVDITSRYESLNRNNVIGDFRFVVFERFLSYENELPKFERIIMDVYFLLRSFTNTEDKFFGLDTSSIKVEKVPLIIRPVSNVKLRRVGEKEEDKPEKTVVRRATIHEADSTEA